MRSDEDFEPITIKYFDGSYQEYFYQQTTETETKNKFKKK
jgi:hypothetical protein